MVRYGIIQQAKGIFKNVNISASYALQDFTYRNYKVIEADYTNNRLPGNARNYATLMLDAYFAKDFYLNSTYTYSDKIYLNDANLEAASSYQLLAVRLGWKKLLAHHIVDIFAGGDNLFNTTYSLGNDINAAAGRYYNASPGRKYFVGICWRWRK